MNDEAWETSELGDGYDYPLRLLISTMPAWPGPEEAERVEGYWPGLTRLIG